MEDILMLKEASVKCMLFSLMLYLLCAFMPSSVVYCYLCALLSVLSPVVSVCACACAGREDPLDLELPNQWLWDIIDEFLYQVRNESGSTHC